MLHRIGFLLLVGLGIAVAGRAQSTAPTGCEGVPDTLNCKLIEDFESYPLGGPPTRWRDTKDRELVRLSEDGVMTPRKNVNVRRENDNQFARIYTEAKALRVVRTRRNGLDWNLEKRPVLRWKWRATALPEGANEKDRDRNDTGGAVYVTLDTDWLGRPKSIKYTYSSSLPVGTTVDYGPLKVLVVASKAEQGLGAWIAHERNVVADYKRLFGERPDTTPAAVVIWGDSNNMDSVSTVDFDDLLVLSGTTASRSESTTASSGAR